jgi:hypothetical protein
MTKTMVQTCLEQSKPFQNPIQLNVQKCDVSPDFQTYQRGISMVIVEEKVSIFQYLPNDVHACPFIHVWKYCHTA